ncbi:nucleoside hydrolase [Tessaracoccus sp. Z1128]
MPTKILLDCDTGVDDTLAILYAALHPDIDLVGVGTVWGNVDVPTGTRNSIHTLEMVGMGHVPVARGAAGPLLGGEASFAYHVHGDDGQGNAGTGRSVGPAVPGTAAEQIVRLARRHPGEITLVPVGPLTNVALALGLEPELPSLIKEVVLMGGTAQAPGNVSPVAEANIAHDAWAAQAVFAAPWPITMVGLDVTMKTLITPERRAVLDAGGSLGRYVSRIHQFYGEFFQHNDFSQWRATMHDTMAVAAAAGTLRITLAPVVHVEVDVSGGPSHGQTICDLRGIYRGYPAQEGAHCRVVLECDDTIADDAVALVASFGDALTPTE